MARAREPVAQQSQKKEHMNTKYKKPQDSKFLSYEHLDKIGETAVYYGFAPMKGPAITKADTDAAKDIMEGDDIDDETDKHGRLPLHAEEKIALIRSYYEAGWHALPQPVMLYFKDAFKGSIKKSGYHRYADLEIIGSSGSIAEATLIQASRAMLAEEGYPSTAVEINSIGDRDSIARFARELAAYYRKHINEMTPEARQMLKRDPFELLSCHDESCAELNAKAPRSMDFLSESSRRHLEEILEYCETLGIPYTINNSLIGNRKYCTETIVAIVNTCEDKKAQRILAVGVRYNGLAKRLNMKRDIQGVGMSILVKESRPALRKSVSKMKRPISSFVQLGMESKLLSLDIIERLRQAKIPLYLCLAKDRLGAQVSANERFHMPYTIVMGKKEAVEKTAIVRNTDTHAQSVIALEELPKHMKKLEAEYWK
jgi:histidyl-tRNA synthetase